MIDNSDAEINAIQAIFPSTKIFNMSLACYPSLAKKYKGKNKSNFRFINLSIYFQYVAS